MIPDTGQLPRIVQAPDSFRAGCIKNLKEDSVLIGKINDKSRQKILVTIKEVKGSRLIDLRLHQTNDEGSLLRPLRESLLPWNRPIRRSNC